MEAHSRLSAALGMIAIMSMHSAARANPPQAPSLFTAPAPVAAPVVKLNPHARDGHVLSFHFDDLPQALTQVTATADFQVANVECVPVDYGKAIGGVRLAPRHSLPLSLNRGDDGRYVAIVHVDALLDEDYYGLGVCRWELTTATVHFHSPSTHFVGGLKAERLIAGGETVQYYLTRDLAHKPRSMDYVYGETAADFYQPSAGPQFTLVLNAHKEVP